MPESPKRSEPRHPIAVVSSRTGLPQDLLRAWERRYGAVVPGRTTTGRRLYSDLDLEKLRLLKQAIEGGRRIGDVASLDVRELQQILREESPFFPASPESSGTGGAGVAADYVKKALESIETLEGGTLEALLRQASVEVSPLVLRNEIIRPVLQIVGERWRAGSLRIANEHLATAVIRSFLGSLRLNGGAPSRGPSIIVSTPAGQRHELGALLSALAAMEVGWEAVYLGPDLPAAEIAAAARVRGARAIALSLVGPTSDPRLREELTQLRELVGPEVSLFVGGAAASALGDVLGKIGARHLEEPRDLQAALEATS